MMRRLREGEEWVAEDKIAQVAIDFIAFCFERKGADWPVLYDEMCFVAGKRLYRGLGYEELLVGSGAAAQAGGVVAVHYTGWLTDGTKFDSSRDRGQVYVFPLGRQQVIAGWDEGVAGMKVGGRRKLVIPPALGYGNDANGPIPAGSTLVFDVELCGVR